MKFLPDKVFLDTKGRLIVLTHIRQHSGLTFGQILDPRPRLSRKRCVAYDRHGQEKFRNDGTKLISEVENDELALSFISGNGGVA